jgi:hypothetical protein
MSAVCFASHFGVSTAIAELGSLAFDSGDAEAAVRFNQLHRISVGLFVLVGFSSVLLMGLYARADARESST